MNVVSFSETSSDTTKVTQKFQPQQYSTDKVVMIGDAPLTLDDVVHVARHGQQVGLTVQEEILQRIDASCDYIADAVKSGKPIYGVTSGFGGMAHIAIAPEQAAELQNNLIWYHKAGTGKKLPLADVSCGLIRTYTVHQVFDLNYFSD
jgi:phenylalanine ammonia-lyase